MSVTVYIKLSNGSTIREETKMLRLEDEGSVETDDYTHVDVEEVNVIGEPAIIHLRNQHWTSSSYSADTGMCLTPKKD